MTAVAVEQPTGSAIVRDSRRAATASAAMVSAVLEANRAELEAHVAFLIESAITGRVRHIRREESYQGLVETLPGIEDIAVTIPSVSVPAELALALAVWVASEGTKPQTLAFFGNDPFICDESVSIREFYCSWPGCKHGPGGTPFPTSSGISSHRYAAHLVRSSNFESISRQYRRDRIREQKRLDEEERSGKPKPMKPGPREQLRRRLAFLTPTLAREFGATPSQLLMTMGELCSQQLEAQQQYRLSTVSDSAYNAHGATAYSTAKAGS